MTIHVTEDRSISASSGSIAQKVVYALLEIAFLLSPRNPSTVGHRDLVGVGDYDFPVSCILIARHTVPCDVVSSTEVASAESRLTILCFDNCPHTRLLCGGLLGFGVMISELDFQTLLDGGASCGVDTFKEEAPLLKVC
jgi:hypothetical protein